MINEIYNIYDMNHFSVTDDIYFGLDKKKKVSENNYPSGILLINKKLENTVNMRVYKEKKQK
ncbi:MAG: hypothetical protein IJ683_00435 [Butyrivibrio sp.]|nr:hypothetical protein [Butyrivibrio sp.]MBR1640785.1 hypothetical protein [Butyrivibrio sp.]